MEDLINDMSNVTVDIKNREFLIACEDGKEEEVLELAKIFSERVSKLSERLNDLDHERLFLLAGILAEEDNKNLLKASGLDKAMNNIKKIAEKFDEIDYTLSIGNLKSLKKNDDEEKFDLIPVKFNSINNEKLSIEKSLEKTRFRQAESNICLNKNSSHSTIEVKLNNLFSLINKSKKRTIEFN